MSAAVILQIAAGLIGLVSLWYKEYQAKAPQRKEEAQIEKLDDFREAVAKGDSATVSGMLSDQHARVQSLCYPAIGINGADKPR